MWRRAFIYITVPLLLAGEWTSAQKVLYSPFIDEPFDIAGKAGDYYWIERREKPKPVKRHVAAFPGDELEKQVFDVYDERMNLINSTAPFNLDDKILKEYYVCNDYFFDQVVLVGAGGKTHLMINRYNGDGTIGATGKILFSYPFEEAPNSFVLVRSEDRSKLLMLCFQVGGPEGSSIHAVLFDDNWHQLSNKIYKYPYFSQPFVQDDFVNYPADNFSNNPVKLGNTGQWLMASPSRSSNNFLLFDFPVRDSSFLVKEIRLPGLSRWQDVALCLNDRDGEGYLGILSEFSFSTLKNVEVVHYSLAGHLVDFDSSYRFNTLVAFNTRDANITHENFIAVPGSGFMLLKEYGMPFLDPYSEEGYLDLIDLVSIFSMDSIMNIAKPQRVNRNGYTRYDKLGGSRRNYDRGDLCLFYFPAHKTDSSWSAIIDQEQVTDLNSPNLSYLVVPLNQRIFLFYNSFFRDADQQQFGNSTIIDDKGNLVSDQGIVYWRYRDELLFQQSRQIGENEVAMHYANFKRTGFAIIRF